MTFTLLTIYFTALAQTSPARSWVDTEITYADSAGKTIKVYNSLPKGGGGYLHSKGKDYSYVIFWTRIVNESATPFKLTVAFPADSFSMFPNPNSYIKLLIPSDTMTTEKIALGDYGLTNLSSILNNGFNKPGIVEKTLNPKEESLFYTPIFIHEARGTARTSFIFEGNNLFYRVSIDPYSMLIPCGHIEFK